MEILDGTILTVAAPAIAADLGVAPVDVSAAMTGYLVAVAAGIPISGWLTDRFGGRRIMVIAIGLFTVASVVCAVSPTLGVLVAARIVQGAGGALMVPVGQLVVLRTTPKGQLLNAIAYLTWPALLAPVIAPTLGGWIVTVASWHWIFLINVPLGLVALVVAVRIVPPERAGRAKPLDWVGFLLIGGVLSSLLIGIELLAPGVGWGPRLVAAFGFGLALTGAVLWWRHAPQPLLGFSALRARSYRVTNTGGAVYRMVITAVPFLLPLLFQVGFGWSPVRAGNMLLLLFLGNIAIKPATTPLIRRFGFRAVLIAAISGGAAILVLIATLQAETPLAVIAAVLFLSGVCRSSGFSGFNSLQFADLDAGALADANTVSSTVQQVAAALGVAIGALLLRSAEVVLPEYAYPATFVVLALMMLQPLIQVLRLPRSVGAAVSGRSP